MSTSDTGFKKRIASTVEDYDISNHLGMKKGLKVEIKVSGRSLLEVHSSPHRIALSEGLLSLLIQHARQL